MDLRHRFQWFILVLTLLMPQINGHRNPLISTCPGEGMYFLISNIESKISISTIKSAGPRYGDFKCIHDRTHRVCAKLVDNPTSCNELSWNDNGASFWDITGQQRWNWKDTICRPPNPGDSWCICMWATASLIKAVSYKAGYVNT